MNFIFPLTIPTQHGSLLLHASGKPKESRRDRITSQSDKAVNDCCGGFWGGGEKGL